MGLTGPQTGSVAQPPAPPVVVEDLRPRATWKLVAEALLIWVAFTVAISVLPFLVSLVSALDQAERVSLSQVGGQGQFLLVAVAILAAGIGDLIRCRRGQSGLLWIGLLGLAFVVVVGAVWWFADISGLLRDNRHVDSSFVATSSMLVLLASIAVGGSCVLVAERAR